MQMKEKLSVLFSPSSIAVIGASNNFDRLGYHVMKSLVEGGYSGTVYPVNPNDSKVWGMSCYPSLKEIPTAVDMAVIVVPARFIPEILEECGEKGVKGAVIISAGFREIEDPAGTDLQEKIREITTKWSLPVIGPNTLGFVNLSHSVNASFVPEFSLVSSDGISLVAQSGGFSATCAHLAIEQKMGFSKIVGIGNRCNIDFPEMVDYLAEDPDTRVIALYIEGMDDPRRLLEAASRVRGKKPIIACKGGRSKRGNEASRFHTGSLAGNYNIWQGAFRQSGILEVNSIEELLDVTKAAEILPPLKGDRIAVLSTQAGPGMVASDHVEAMGLQLSRFNPQTQEKINQLLPPVAMRTNPVDMGPAWYNLPAIIDIVKVILKDENVDGLIFLAVYASANVGLSKGIREYFEKSEPLSKPLILSFAAPPGTWQEDIQAIDRRRNVIFLPTPERAARAMGALLQLQIKS